MDKYEKKLLRQMKNDLTKHDKAKKLKACVAFGMLPEKETIERLHYQIYIGNLIGWRIVNRMIKKSLEKTFKNIVKDMTKGKPCTNV